MFLLLEFSPWVIGIALFIILLVIITVQEEQYVWSTVICIASLAILQFIMKVDIWNYISINPTKLLVISLIYLSLSILWSGVKWVTFLYKFKEYRAQKIIAYYQERELYLKQHNERLIAIGKEPLLSDSEEGKKVLGKMSEFAFLNDEFYKNSRLTKAPSFHKYKTDIVAWVIFWIPSFIGTLLNDFVHKLVTWIVTRFSAVYQTLSNKIVGDYPNNSIKE